MTTLSVNREPQGYVIMFSEPVRLYVLAVATPAGDIVWKLSPQAFQQSDYVSAAFFSSEADFGAFEFQSDVKRHDATDVAVDFAPIPNVPLVHSVTYGSVPAGYKECTAARQLEEATTYHIIAMGAGGSATATFTTDD